jgi:hypothetical protein
MMRLAARAAPLTLLAALALALSAPARAAAQRQSATGQSATTQTGDATGPTRAERTEARALFEQARTAIQEGRFAAARDLLRRSLELAPNPGSAFNLAIALRGTGELRSAVGTFEALLAGGHGELSPAQAREATDLMARTRAELAHLEVHVTGAPSVEVRLDGELVGEAPEGGTVRTEVDPGAHVLTASAPRRVPYEERLTIEPGATVVAHAELAASALGTLVVEAASPDAIVEIDGIARGRGTVQRELPPGDYRVSVRVGDHTETRTAHLEGGALLRVALTGEVEAPILESPWLWTGLGVLVAGAVVAIVVPLTVVVEGEPVRDDRYGPGGVVVTLTAPLP